MACGPCNKSRNSLIEKKNAEIAKRVTLPVPIPAPQPQQPPSQTSLSQPSPTNQNKAKQFVIVSKINRVQQQLEDIKNFEAGLKTNSPV